MKGYTRIAPEIGSIITVYHPHRGSVEMIVSGEPFANTIPCEYDGEEYTVRLGKIDDDYRWEAESI